MAEQSATPFSLSPALPAVHRHFAGGQQSWEPEGLEWLVSNPTSNLFLVGLMGAGKSTVGRHLAKRLGKRFVDSDREIESRTGVSIPVIFEIEGEEGFRRREASIIEELTRASDVVLATGGGAITHAQTRRVLRERGFTIYLCAALDDLVARTRHDRQRPLLQQGNRREKLAELLNARDPWYREVAHLVVLTGRPGADRVAETIIAALEGHGEPSASLVPEAIPNSGGSA